jgi:hypothetical protein
MNLKTLCFIALFLNLGLSFLPGGTLVFAPGEADGVSNAVQKALIIYENNTQRMTLHPEYYGDADHLGWIIPVSKDAKVEQHESLYGGIPYPIEAPMIPGHGNVASVEPYFELIPNRASRGRRVQEVSHMLFTGPTLEELKSWCENNKLLFPTNQAAVFERYLNEGWNFVAVRFNFAPPWRAPVAPTGSGSSASALTLAKPTPEIRISYPTPHPIYPLELARTQGGSAYLSLHLFSREYWAEPNLYQLNARKLASNPAHFEQSQPVPARNATAFSLLSKLKGKLPEERLLNLRTNISALVDRLFGPSPLPPKGDRLVPNRNGVPLLFIQTHRQIGDSSSSMGTPNFGEGVWYAHTIRTQLEGEALKDLQFSRAIPFLIKQVGHSNGTLAAYNLAYLGSEGAAAVNQLLTSEVAEERINTVLGLVENRPELIHPSASSLLRDPEPAVREQAVRLLSWDDAPTEADLGALFNEQDPAVLKTWLSRLQFMPFTNRTVLRPQLTQHLLSHTNPAVQILAYEVAATNKAVLFPRETLVGFLNSDNWEVVNTATTWLRHSQPLDQAAINNLKNNKLPAARLVAMETLAKSRSPESHGAVRTFLNDPEELIVARAEQLLAELERQ